MASALVAGNRRARRHVAAAPPVIANNNDDGMPLPTDILCEVLLRLPADELCRLRLVCRSWRSLTSDPIFAKAHSSRHPIVAGFHIPSNEIRFMDLSGNVVKRIRVPEDHAQLHLCWQLDMACISASHTRACVLNTATGAGAALPSDIPNEHDRRMDYLGASMFTLGHIPTTGEFKVLRIHSCRGDRIDNNNNLYLCLYQMCDIMTLGNGDGRRWRVKPHPPFKIVSNNGYNTVLNNGIIYFLVHTNFGEDSTNIKIDDIASFDLVAEEWKSAMIQGPLSIHLASTNKNILYKRYKHNIRITGLDGCLVTTLYDRYDCSMDLWFLVDVDSCTWNKRYSMRCIPHLGRSYFITPYPLVVLEDERVLVWDEYALKAYDTRTTTWEYLTSIKDCFYVRKHEGSLLQSRSSDV